MRILVVTNLYPPHHLGGYELGCGDIVRRLRSRGHEVRVLTGSFRVAHGEGMPEDEGIERSLRFSTDGVFPMTEQVAECRKFSAVLGKFSPAVVYFSNQAGLCRWLPIVARRLGYPTAFFLSDTTFISWKVGAWLAGPVAKNPVMRALFGGTFLAGGRAVVQDQACHFASEFLMRVAQTNGIRYSKTNSLVTYWGIEAGQFQTAPPRRGPLRKLLYVGRLSPQKGVHTAIKALALLVAEKEFSGLTLTLAGGGPDRDYAQKMREATVAMKLGDRVNFAGELPRSDLPRIYAEHDALIFPSEWDEPFAITPLEAMASGLPVIGTLTGGSPELFRNRETAMTYRAGDEMDCARAVRELAADDELRQRIAKMAQETVLKKHTIDVMVDGIEGSLKKIAGR